MYINQCSHTDQNKIILLKKTRYKRLIYLRFRSVLDPFWIFFFQLDYNDCCIFKQHVARDG